ncbi:MAG TPA: type IV pilus modification protein PilV [Rhodocyclaceae bacterium]
MHPHATASKQSPIHFQKGVSLLEVLVTVLVLSFGLLGVAGLQTTALKATHSSYYRSIANALAADIVDRLRANVLTQTRGNQAATARYYVSPGSPSVNCSTSVCTGQGLANYEMAAWKASVASLLPAGGATLCIDGTPYDGTSDADIQCDDAADGHWVVKVWWDDSRGKLAANRSDANAYVAQRLVVIFTP